jgi:hypothetical protein
MEEYKIRFDSNNSNIILIYKKGKLHNMVACPHCQEGCDIINFSDKINRGYTFNFDGLILITTEKIRKIFYRGNLIAITKR